MVQTLFYRSEQEFARAAAKHPRTDTRQRMMDAGMTLFYEKGFNAVGLAQVLQLAQVTKTTFYNHFESKDDLILAALIERDERGLKQWHDEVHDLCNGVPRRMLMAFFESLDDWFSDEKFHGCIFTNAAIEFPNPHNPIHQAGACHKHRIESMFAQVAKQAGAAHPESLAQDLMIVIEGALVWHHVAGRPHVASRATKLAQALIDGAISEQKHLV